MRDLNRIPDFCNKLAEIWMKVPDFRFGQLINNVCAFTRNDNFYTEDDKMIKKIEEYVNILVKDEI